MLLSGKMNYDWKTNGDDEDHAWNIYGLKMVPGQVKGKLGKRTELESEAERKLQDEQKTFDERQDDAMMQEETTDGPSSANDKGDEDDDNFQKFFPVPIKWRRLPIKASIRPELPVEGRNEFKFFDYDKFANLRTVITPEHRLFMFDNGIIAMHCEMIGVRADGKASAVARVTMVNEYGFCIYDKFVKPQQEGRTYCTDISGVSKKDLKTVEPFFTVQKEVKGIIQSHVLIGHSLDQGLEALQLYHPLPQIRDSAIYFKYKLKYDQTPELSQLVKHTFGKEIQFGEHSLIIFAQLTMALYQSCHRAWEKSFRNAFGYNVQEETLNAFDDLRTAEQNERFK